MLFRVEIRRVNAGESSDDNLRSTRSRAFVPTEAWIDAFDAQCTEALLKRLRRYALLLARLPGGEFLGDQASYAEEVVQATVTDIVSGTLRWDPATRDLEPYLTDTIRLRVRRDRRRAARYAHVSIDAAYPSTRASLLDEVESRLAADASSLPGEHHGSMWGSMTHSMQRLRELLSADSLAQRFLDALNAGASTRAEVMRTAGLTRAEYHNTRRRIARLLAHLEPDECMPGRDN